MSTDPVDLLRRAAQHLAGLSESGCGAPWDRPLARWLARCATTVSTYPDNQTAEEHASDALAVARAVLREPDPTGGATDV